MRALSQPAISETYWGTIMPNHWLLKTEPSTYSYADLEREGRSVWDGVANALALKHLRAVKKGDLAFIYHTGSEKQIVGIAEVVSDAYPDPKETESKLVVVDLKSRGRLKRAVTLAEIKARKEFADFELVRIGRLSVMPVSEERWQAINRLAQKAD
jgi:predicted RNA-binding protein with PUA-like domain